MTEDDDQIGPSEYPSGALVRYVGADVFDRLIRTGDVGTVQSVSDGWVRARWPSGGVHRVPTQSVRLLSSGHSPGEAEL